MLKKAKLFSLLLVIVASTAVGLFGPSTTSYAANGITYSEGCNSEPAKCTITLSSDSDIHKAYGDDTSTMEFSYNPSIVKTPELLQATGIPASAIVFLDTTIPSTQTKAANDNGWSRVMYIFYFQTIDDYNNKTNGYFLPVYTGKYNENNQAQPKTYQNKSAPTLVTSENAGGVVDDEEEQAQEPDPEPEPATEVEAETPSNCQIPGGTGWIVCPIVHFFAAITDSSYYLLDKFLLKLEPIALPGKADGEVEIYNAWKLMRDFANICFIIAFMIIVFSQLTNVGVNNYGIKKLLPKIVIAVILVNVSFYLCAVAVDLSNIVGNTLRGLLDSLNASGNPTGSPIDISYVNPDDPMDIQTATNWQELAQMVLGGVIGVAALTYAMYAYVAVMVPVLFAAALAVITVVVALTLRQALVVILIVVSPLAFVALLLPNTEGYFQKWRSLFTVMLLVYPAVSLVFGASALASRILMGSNDFPTQLVGAGVSVIPLFITPIIMKVSGGVLNRWVGLVNDPAKGPIDGMRKGLERKTTRIENRRRMEATDSTRNGGILRHRYSRYRRQADMKKLDSSLEGGASYAETEYLAKKISDPDNEGFRNELAGGTNIPLVGGQDIPLVGGKTIPGWVPKVGGNTIPAAIPTERRAASGAARQSVNANALSTLKQLEKKEVEERIELIESAGPTTQALNRAQTELLNANSIGDTIGARAAAKMLSNGGGKGNEMLDDTIRAIESSGHANSDVLESLRADLKGQKASNSARDKWATKGGTLESHYMPGSDAMSRLNEQELAGQQLHELKDAVENTLLSQDAAIRVLDKHAKGTIPLDEDKLQIFRHVATHGPGVPLPLGPRARSPITVPPRRTP